MRESTDQKDELILRQQETIRTMAEHSLNRMGTDFGEIQRSLPSRLKKNRRKRL